MLILFETNLISMQLHRRHLGLLDYSTWGVWSGTG